MPDIELSLKNTMRSLRIKFGYTQEESAKLLGITAVTLRSWESESGTITLDVVKRIEDLYNTKHEYIFFGSEAAFIKLLRGSVLTGKSSLAILTVSLLIFYMAYDPMFIVGMGV